MCNLVLVASYLLYTIQFVSVIIDFKKNYTAVLPHLIYGHHLYTLLLGGLVPNTALELTTGHIFNGLNPAELCGLQADNQGANREIRM